MKAAARLLLAVVFCTAVDAQPRDPLPSWNDGPIKARIILVIFCDDIGQTNISAYTHQGPTK